MNERDVVRTIPNTDLPPNVRLPNPKTGRHRLSFRRGGKQYYHDDKDVDALVAWRVAKEAELDALGVPPTRVVTAAARQSVHAGVGWYAQTSKWAGRLHNRLTGKIEYTTPILFAGTDAGEEACRAAVAVLRARLDAEFEAHLQRFQEEHAWTKELERAPADASHAERGKVYWHVSKVAGWEKPYRVLVSGKIYQRACQDCDRMAFPNTKGEAATHCAQHGGGGVKMCIHERHRGSCHVCNGDAHQFCSVCQHTMLYAKRMLRNGGNGLCAPCEDHAKAQAAANGTAPPQKSKKWEDVVFDALLPQIVDADGDVVAPELRDDFSHTIGSLYEEKIDGGGRKLRKRKRGSTDCDTTTYRRPDALFVVRHPQTARIVAALAVEVDEDCHVMRKFECETGKVEDTFQALQKLAAGEGASSASRTGVRADAEFVLFQTFKFNPNACDLGTFALKDRITVLAKHINAFLRTTTEEFVAMSAEEKMVPHVTCLFYHSKATAATGEVFLEAYPALVPQWKWGGNVLGNTTGR